ncbi:alpha/beta hydrolase [Actinomadura scrupuli]|uniref:alpha/beta hydrolase n=1 Tax=Actinomadura scrupuli TaxID=559629 RepID=UPI003D99B126
MELTSTGLISLLFLAAVGVTAATVLLWPRFAARGVRPVLSRIALILGSQVTLTLALVAAINSYFLFYGSWGELLGTQQENAQVTHNDRGGTVSPANPLGRSLSGLVDGDRSKDPAKYGQLENISIPGARTGFTQHAYVLLPPEYFQQRFQKRRFPVAIMLTGYPGSTKSLITRLKLPEFVHKGVAAGALAPAIYVMITPTVAPPRDTECTDVPAGPKAATYFGQDVPEALAGSYRVAADRNGWGIMGDSTGGYCAAKIAMMYPDRYSAAVNMSGHFRAIKDMTTGDLWGGSPTVRNENDLIWRIQHLPAPPISLLITSAERGERSYPQAKQFIPLVRPPMQLDTLILRSGGHNYQTYGEVFPSVLEWMSQHLRAG